MTIADPIAPAPANTRTSRHERRLREIRRLRSELVVLLTEAAADRVEPTAYFHSQPSDVIALQALDLLAETPWRDR